MKIFGSPIHQITTFTKHADQQDKAAIQYLFMGITESLVTSY
nr:MAG TPA: hypothetical protein [Caudoviricetes sp.]